MANQYTIDPATPVIEQEILEGIVEIFGSEDPTAILDLIDTFLVESAKQCNEMQRAMAAQDWTLLHRMAHSLKSSSATFGAMRLSQISAYLEHEAKGKCTGADCTTLLTVLLAEHETACNALRIERSGFAGE